MWFLCSMLARLFFFFFFFFNDTATTEIYTLSLHDALPICMENGGWPLDGGDPTRSLQTVRASRRDARSGRERLDRKSTRLNSSHGYISYAVFCLKKKKKKKE